MNHYSKSIAIDWIKQQMNVVCGQSHLSVFLLKFTVVLDVPLNRKGIVYRRCPTIQKKEQFLLQMQNTHLYRFSKM